MQPLLLFSLSLLSTLASAFSPINNVLIRQEHSNGCQLVLIVVGPVPAGWMPCGSPGYYLPEVSCLCCDGLGGCAKDTQICGSDDCIDLVAEGSSAAAAPAVSTVATYSSPVAEPTSQTAVAFTSESPAAIPTTESVATSSLAPAESSAPSSTIGLPASSTQVAASSTSSSPAVSTGLLVWDMGWVACVTASVFVLMGFL